MKARGILTALAQPEHEYHALMANVRLNMPYCEAVHEFMLVFSPVMDFIEQKRSKK